MSSIRSGFRRLIEIPAQAPEAIAKLERALERRSIRYRRQFCRDYSRKGKIAQEHYAQWRFLVPGRDLGIAQDVLMELLALSVPAKAETQAPGEQG